MKDGGGQGVQIELGAGQALPEIDAALIGKSVGDKATAEHTFPAEHPREDFRGKTGTFAITIERPEGARSADRSTTSSRRTSASTRWSRSAPTSTPSSRRPSRIAPRRSLAEQIVEKLNELNPCDVPPSLVEQQCRIMEQEVVHAGAPHGSAHHAGAGARRCTSAILADAERKVRAGLLMAAIARKNEFKVTDEDIEKGLAELAEETGKNVAKLRVEYREKSKRDILIGMILEDKILDFIEAKSKITDGDPPEAREPRPRHARRRHRRQAQRSRKTKKRSREKKEG